MGYKDLLALKYRFGMLQQCSTSGGKHYILRYAGRLSLHVVSHEERGSEGAFCLATDRLASPHTSSWLHGATVTLTRKGKSATVTG